jgi:hypothetical protein
MTVHGRIFAAMYDPMMRRAEKAGLRTLREDLLAQASGDVLEIGAGTVRTCRSTAMRSPRSR